jgi:hypothetical protein
VLGARITISTVGRAVFLCVSFGLVKKQRLCVFQTILVATDLPADKASHLVREASKIPITAQAPPLSLSPSSSLQHAVGEPTATSLARADERFLCVAKPLGAPDEFA